MINWFKQLVVRWVREDWAYASQPSQWDDSPKIRIGTTKSISGRESLDSDATLTFTVYNAIGGKVVEFRRYDRRTDQSEHSVYVIAKDEDFGEKIAKIATLETIKG